MWCNFNFGRLNQVESILSNNFLSGVPIEIKDDWLWIIFSFVFVIFAIMTLVLMYHWNKYGLWHNKGVFLAEAAYLLGSAFFILGAIASVLSF